MPNTIKNDKYLNQARPVFARFVGQSVKPVIFQLSRKLRVTYWPRRRRTLSAILLALLTSFAQHFSHAAPTGAQVVSGAANVVRVTPNRTQILQTTNNAIINWQSFSIGANETVNFIQPSVTSVALNRVVGSDPSRIFGGLSANGQVFLVNAAGVYFALGSTVSVGGLVATSMNITDANFASGKYRFDTTPNAGAVSNDGKLSGTYVVLAGPQVSNTGSINAPQGSVGLAAGGRVNLSIAGDQLVSLSVDAATADAAIVNSGNISADGGKVFMTTRSSNAVLDTVINTSGIVRATSLVNRNGEIVIDGGTAGVVAVSGALTTAGIAAGSSGGTVKVLGDKVGLFAGTTIDASGDIGGGTVLIGGNFHGAGSEINASLTVVDKSALIKADAVTSGHGGNVAVWADGHTRFAGDISAKGGAFGGDGGFVETSGKGALDFSGSVNTSATNGKTGTLLLDPTNIVINNNQQSAGMTENANVFSDTTTSASILNASTLGTALSHNSVIVDTNSSQSGRGNITVQAPISWSSNVNALTLKATGNITLNSTISNAGSAAITMMAGAGLNAGDATGGNIIFNSGNINVGVGGQAILYTGSVNGSNGLSALVGAGSGNFRYDSSPGTTNYASALSGGINIIYREQPTLVIAPLHAAMTYGDSLSALSTYVTGLVNGDTLAQTIASPASMTIAGATSSSGNLVAGAHVTTASGGAEKLGYKISYGTNTLDVLQKAITLTGITALDKVYDATTGVTLVTNGATLNNGAATQGDNKYYNGDSVSFNASGATGNFVNKDVGVGKTVIVNGPVLTGADAANYTVSSSTQATITPKAITATGISAVDKVYDAATSANLDTSGATLSHGAMNQSDNKVYASDAVTLNASAATGIFSSKNVAVGKNVSVNGLTLQGRDAANYSVTDASGATAGITPKAITVTGITALDKIYDATTGATLISSAATLNSGAATTSDNKIYSSDVVTFSTSGATGATGQFVTKDVGVGKTVIVNGLALNGSDSANYTVSATAQANITPKAITATGISASNKIYDTTTNATIDTGGATLGNKVYSGDSVSIDSSGASGTFLNKTAAVGKSVTVGGLRLTGVDALDYTVTDASGTVASITPKAITAMGISAADKVYDATTSAILITTGAILSNGATGQSDNKVFTSDIVTLNTSAASGMFGSKNVAAGKNVNVSGLFLQGVDAANYSVTDASGATASITPKALTATGIAALDKVYDTTTNATIVTAAATLNNGAATAFDNKFYTGDGVTLVTNAATGVYLNKAAGNAKVVNVNGLTLSGSDAANYVVSATSNASIAPKPITASGVTALGKVYDATPSAILNTSAATLTTGATTASDNKFYNGDVVSLNTSNASGAYLTKSAAVAKVINVSGLTLTGMDAANYTVTDASHITATIIPAMISSVAGITGVTKVYDGNTLGTSNLNGASFNGIIAADVLTAASASAAFSDKNVGTGKIVSITNIVLGGPDKDNYTLSNNTATSTADITRLNAVTWTGPANGNWSLASNWAGSAIPDFANVSQVIIPAGSNVTFDSNVGTIGGAVKLDSVSSIGGLIVASGHLTVAGSLTTNSYSQSAGTVEAGSLTANSNFQQAGGNLIATGNISITQPVGAVLLGAMNAAALTITSADAITQSGPAVINGNTMISAAGQTVMLTNPGNNFVGSVTDTSAVTNIVNTSPLTAHLTTTGDTSVTAKNGLTLDGSVIGNLGTQSTALNFGATSVAGNLSTTATGAITQTGPLIVNGNTTIAAVGQSMTLSSPGNRFVGTVTDTSAATNLVDTSPLTAHITTTGDTNITAMNGATLDGSVAGNLSAQAGTLNFGTTTVAGNLTTQSTALNVGATTVAGNFNATASGTITQTGPLIVNGNTTIAAGGQSVALGNPGNSFGGTVTDSSAVTILVDTRPLTAHITTTGDTSITAMNGLTLDGSVIGNLGTQSTALNFGATSVTGNLSATATGAITQTGPLIVSGNTTIAAAGQSVTLSNPGNRFVGTVTDTSAATNLVDMSPLTAHVTTTGDTNITAMNGATLDGSVAGNLSAQAGTLNFGTTTVAGNLTTQSTALNVGTTTVAGNFNATATGAITQTGPLTVNGSTTIAAAGQSVTLNNAGNAFIGSVTDTSAVTNLVDSSVLIAHLTTTGNTSVTAMSGLTVDGNVVGNLNVQAGTLNFGNTTVSGNLSTQSAALNFGATTVAGNLSATAKGPITQNGPLRISGNTTIAAAGQSVTLSNPGNSFVGDVTDTSAATNIVDGSPITAHLTTTGDTSITSISATNGVTVDGSVVGNLSTQSAALHFGGTSVIGNLSAIATGAVTQSGQVAISGTTTIAAAGQNVTLMNSANNFVGAVSVTGTTVSLNDDNILTLGTISADRANLSAGNQLQVASRGLINASNIHLSLGASGKQIGSLTNLFNILPGATVTFGALSPVVPAYFYAYPLIQFRFDNLNTQDLYANGAVPLFVDGMLVNNKLVMAANATLNSSISQVLQATQKRAARYVDAVNSGLSSNLTERLAFPHSGSLKLKGPESQL